MTDFQQIDPQGTPTSALICMHGLGARSDDFLDFAHHFGFAESHGTRFVLPNAPIRPVTVSMGMPLPAWYDIRSPDVLDAVDQEGITESVYSIQSLIDDQIKSGIAADQIVVAGFSQGAVMALLSTITYPAKLAGCVVMAGYDPLPDTEVHSTNQDSPILWLHGTEDPIVPYTVAEQSITGLKSRQLDIQHKAYPMAHTLNEQAVVDLRDWLAGRWRPRA